MRTLLLMLFLAAPALAEPAPPQGVAPGLVVRPLSAVPNAQAIGARLWVPDLDAGFIPQGLAVDGARLALAGYVSTDRAQGRGPCRVLWIDPARGAVTRRLDLPPACGHAGGAAALPGARLLVADTRILFVVGAAGLERAVALAGGLRGSFADFDGRDVWIGAYDKAGGTLWRLPLAALDKDAIDARDALETRVAPAEIQGLAFDRAGSMWASVSNGRAGALLRLDSAGAVTARYAAPAGIEDIAFAPDRTLWASSEAGTLRWSDWPTFFPLLFSIDVTALR